MNELTQIIRAYVDGELPAADAARLEEKLATDADLVARVRFEERLREGVAEAMTPVATPTAVAASVRQIMATAEPASDPETAEAAAATPEPETSRVARWWAGPPRANAFAVAASLALVAGAVLFGIFGRPIDSIQRSVGGGLISEIAQHVSTEHEGCSVSADAHVRWTTAAEAQAELSIALEAAVEVFDLSDAGYRFVGAGPCQLPTPSPSGHLIYAREGPAPDGCSTTLLSLFLLPNPPDLEWALGNDPTPWEWVVVGEQPECRARVAACTDGTLAYFLVGCDETQLPRLAGLISTQGLANGD
ncbi:MAG: hypothetical protein HKO59_01645 [Phycisphaerales bacterium]|nr:hypothetical protein [Phycisphaerae bacterium]NNF42349.1 hypothetical protein [Phycisphaerales bacterium]NNM24685.1 hypothetical protein [Phycisphaerales bacterium]